MLPKSAPTISTCPKPALHHHKKCWQLECHIITTAMWASIDAGPPCWRQWNKSLTVKCSTAVFMKSSYSDHLANIPAPSESHMSDTIFCRTWSALKFPLATKNHRYTHLWNIKLMPCNKHCLLTCLGHFSSLTVNWCLAGGMLDRNLPALLVPSE